MKADVLSKRFNMNAYNLRIDGGNPKTSYLLLADVLETQDLRIAFVGFDILQQNRIPYYEYPHAGTLYRVLLPDAWGHKRFAKELFPEILAQPYTYSFFRFASYPSYVKEIPEVIESRKNKDKPLSVKKRLPLDFSDPQKMKERENEIHYERNISRPYNTEFNPDDIKYIKKIADLCERNHVKLFIVLSPEPDCMVKALGDFIKPVSDNLSYLLETNGVNCINTFSDSVFHGGLADSYFYDCDGHMLPEYHEIYTERICDYIEERNWN